MLPGTKSFKGGGRVRGDPPYITKIGKIVLIQNIQLFLHLLSFTWDTPGKCSLSCFSNIYFSVK